MTLDSRLLCLTGRCLVLLLPLFCQPILAQEYLRDETVAPESVDEMAGSFNDLAEPERARRPLRRLLNGGGPFWRDSEFDFNMRGYDLHRETIQSNLSEAFTLGGELAFRSGRFRERLSIGASWYTSQGIDAPLDKDGTGLLGPGQSDLSVLGKAYLQIDAGDFRVKLHRQDFDLPYLNRQDSYMIPNTHEAYILARPGDSQGFAYLVGHLTEMKRRNSKQFVSMGEVAGVSGSNTGTSIVGFRFRPTSAVEISTLALLTSEIFNTVYFESSWRKDLNEDFALNLGAQFSDQRSTGRDLAGSFSTHTQGVRAAVSYRNAILTLAHTATDEGAAIRSPFGGRPGYSSLMLLNFDRAGESASRIGVSYHFGRIGWPALSLQINRARGRSAIDPATGFALADENETDITIDYRPEGGLLEGLWIRYRHAKGGIGLPGPDPEEKRLIANYDLHLF